MCGVKLQWWVDALNEDEEAKNIVPPKAEDVESNC